MQLIRGLSDEKLYQKLRKWSRFHGLSERALGFYLLDFQERNLFKKHGFSSVLHFALIKFHFPPRKTRELLRVGRALEELPLIDRAYADGEISWSAVREITRIAAKETEAEWVAFAKDHSLRQIEQAVSRAAYGERPPKDAFSLSHAKFKVVAALPMEDYAVWKAAFERIAETSGQDLDSATALLILAKAFLEHPLNKSERSARKAFQVVYHRCTDCHNAWLQTNDGPQGIPVTKVAGREKEAAVVRLDEAPPSCSAEVEQTGRQTPAVRVNGAKRTLGVEARQAVKKELVVQAGSSWEKVNGSGKSIPRGTNFCDDRNLCNAQSIDKPNTSRIRQQVLSRDGQQCATPGCQNREELYAHHVVWRSRGGGTDLINEVSVCQTCHSLIHDGLLSVSGEAPLGLNWLDSDGKVLESKKRCQEPFSFGKKVPDTFSYRRVVREDVPRGALKSSEEKPVIYSLDEIPERVDSAWWQKHKHCFTSRGGRFFLRQQT